MLPFRNEQHITPPEKISIYMKGIIRKTFSWYFSRKALPYWCIMLIDCGIIVTAGLISTYIYMGGEKLATNFWDHVLSWILTLPFFIFSMRIFHTYNGILRYSTIRDLIKIAYSLITAFIFILIFRYFLPMALDVEAFSLTVMFEMFMLSLCGLWGIRIIMKWLYDDLIMQTRENVFIYGVQAGGISLAKAIMNGKSMYRLAGFISPDKNLVSRYIMGEKVYTDGPDLIFNLRKSHVKSVIISPMQAERFRNNEELIKKFIDNDIRILVLPKTEEWTPESKVSATQIKEVDIEDLLPRKKIQVDMNAIGKMLTGKNILITGAAGSIGSEMARQIVKYNPKNLILVDQAETPMHDVRRWMAEYVKKAAETQPDSPKPYTPQPTILTIVSDITNNTHMEEIFSEYRPEYVFHAAAYKHVPMMEDNPAIAVQNNVYGTRVIADLSVKYGTKKFVMVSTDKAVNPTNVMGCSKRICEIYCQALNKIILDKEVDKYITPVDAEGGKCQFITTRFGNVLGSNGSVIPIFREQIRNGGPVTVTHPDIIRFFMLISEACQLVLEAGTMGNGGEIFVFDMGEPVRIADLAKRMISLSGAKDVEIKYTGLRDGEKLYEEVLNDAEQTKPTVHPKIKVAEVREYPYAMALKNEEELLEISYTYNDMAIVKKMKDIVPEYKSQHSKYETLD